MRGLQVRVFSGQAHILIIEEAENDHRKAYRHGKDLCLQGDLIPHAGDGVPYLSTRLEPLAHLDPFVLHQKRCPAADGDTAATFPISMLPECRFAARDACSYCRPGIALDAGLRPDAGADNKKPGPPARFSV